jgi:hypothetical protein
MMFLSALYGHGGPTSSFPCILCEVGLADMRCGLKSKDNRTVEGIYEDARKAQQGVSSKECHSITNPPITSIPIENVIPSSLHIFMGILLAILNALEAIAKKLGKIHELEAAYKKLGADKRAFFQAFCGNIH